MTTQMRGTGQGEELILFMGLKKTVGIDEATSQPTVLKRKELQTRPPDGIGEITKGGNRFGGLSLNIFQEILIPFQPRQPDKVTMLEERAYERGVKGDETAWIN
jgi:hypothetical protein